VSPFELAHGFPARIPLTMDLAAHAQLTGDLGVADYALAVYNRHLAAADNVAAAQVRLGRLLDQRATPAEVKPGDQMYLDASPQHSPPHQVPYKLANWWMWPFVSLEVRGPSVRLDLSPELGKISPWVNVSRLKFFEQRDADFTDLQCPVTPVRGGDGMLLYEIQRIWGHRPQGQLPAKEYLVQWKGYDTSRVLPMCRPFCWRTRRRLPLLKRRRPHQNVRRPRRRCQILVVVQLALQHRNLLTSLHLLQVVFDAPFYDLFCRFCQICQV
jgi:hypothetical protein